MVLTSPARCCLYEIYKVIVSDFQRSVKPYAGRKSNTNIKLKALILDRQSKRQNPILPTGSMFLLLQKNKAFNQILV